MSAGNPHFFVGQSRSALSIVFRIFDFCDKTAAFSRRNQYCRGVKKLILSFFTLFAFVRNRAVRLEKYHSGARYAEGISALLPDLFNIGIFSFWQAETPR